MLGKDKHHMPISSNAPSDDRDASQRSFGVEISDLNLELSGRHLLRNVNLSIVPGKVTGLAGESGSGKSLTSYSILQLYPEGSVVTGSVMFRKRNLLALGSREINAVRGRQIAFIFQDPISSFHPMISIKGQITDHMRYHLHLSRRQADARALDLLARVQIPDPREALSKYPHQFSGGQLQRIAIASALACEPEIIIADEPTTALDVTVQAGILHLLRQLCDDLGLTVLLVTHDLGVMSALADNVAVMHEGRIVEYGTRRQIITCPRHPYTKSLIEALPMNVGRSHD